jgi:hypothetical protein
MGPQPDGGVLWGRFVYDFGGAVTATAAIATRLLDKGLSAAAMTTRRTLLRRESSCS